ncbi:unnamed protein product [Acanthosepion pharaonis]|uniref:Uncharacterized protein n=1 Tax=Acanthosepion pharaonis TaxID=158019 RepID=A0A812E5C6_ACAPH|nr:unnamed protein product [Sepia pharaonis]
MMHDCIIPVSFWRVADSHFSSLRFFFFHRSFFVGFLFFPFFTRISHLFLFFFYFFIAFFIRFLLSLLFSLILPYTFLSFFLSIFFHFLFTFLHFLFDSRFSSIFSSYTFFLFFQYSVLYFVFHFNILCFFTWSSCNVIHFCLAVSRLVPFQPSLLSVPDSTTSTLCLLLLCIYITPSSILGQFLLPLLLFFPFSFFLLFFFCRSSFL